MENKQRFLLHISYFGINYSGWQIQDNACTVQGVIMEALHFIVDNKIELMVGAGRTDAQVHAINFFAHFDIPSFNNFSMSNLELVYKLNKFLPSDIVIHYVKKMPIDFHARFSASSRRYEYWISTKKDPFLINKAYFFSKKININLMIQGCKLLIGEKDFSSFSKSKLLNNNCNIYAASIYRKKDIIIFSIESDRFLYNMVRCIVGTLISLGLGKISLVEFKSIIMSRDRSVAGCSVPAFGLYLMNIIYPEKYCIENI